MTTLLSLHSYPVKSCAALDHAAVDFTEAGLAMDRQWLVADAQGQMLTQRTVPRMALLKPSFADGCLRLSAPGMADIEVPLARRADEPPAQPLRVWRSDTLGQDEGGAAAEALSGLLGQPCRLLRVHPRADRQASAAHVDAWLARHGENYPGMPARHRFGFADGFPFLVANQGSLDELNAQLRARGKAAVPMSRFRPNLVLRDLPAYDEDHLAGIRVGDWLFAFVKHCTRCPMPNVDQATGVAGDEPGATLALHRHFEAGILFGVNAVVAGSPGRLAAGDEVEPLYAF